MNSLKYPLLCHQPLRIAPSHSDRLDSRLPPSHNMQQESKLQYQGAKYYLDCLPAHLLIKASTSYDNKYDRKNTIMFNPPSWASPARGESSLEPIGGTIHTNKPIDLTMRTFFRIGRSPNSHIPLLHSTSSRRHALIFHHENGSCYITDCQSTHGTYVDGIKVKPYPHPPKRVRRGALIRFGGPGAPKFVLKSFSVKLEKMVNDLGGVAEAYFPEKLSNSTNPMKYVSPNADNDESTSTTPFEECEERFSVPLRNRNLSTYDKRQKHTESNGMLACIRGDGGGVACISDGLDAPEAALVLLNTRLNAVSRYAMSSESDRVMARTAQRKFENMGMKRKRNSLEDIFQNHACNTTHLLKKPKRSILKSIGNREYESFHDICETPKPQVGQHNRVTPNQIYSHAKTKRRVSFKEEANQSKTIPIDTTIDKIFLYKDELEQSNIRQGLALPVL